MNGLKTRIFRFFACIENYYSEFPHLKLSRILLRLFGLWPYDKTITKRFNYMVFVVHVIIISTILIEGLMEMKSWDTVMAFGTIFGVTWILGSLVLVTTLHVGEHSLKKLYDQMESNWRSMKNAPEQIAILETFTRRTASLIVVYAGWGSIGIPLWLALNFAPWSFKKSQDYENAFSTYSKNWIICEDLRKVQITAHVAVSLCYGALLYFTVLYVYLYSVNHTCGVFAIASCRLRELAKTSSVMLADNVKVADKIIPELLDIIDKHKQAIRTTKILGRTFNPSFHILQIMGLMCVAILIFGLRLSYNLRNIHLTFRVVPILVVVLQYGFYLNYGGERIIEFSNRVFAATCSTCWESTSTNAKKIILMLILRSSQSCVLKAGLMTLSLQNFKTLINIAWSLATVLFSTQKTCDQSRLQC